MRGISRNKIYRDLFLLGSGVTWGKGPRKFIHAARKWREPSASDQPAFYQMEPIEKPLQKPTGLPYRMSFQVNWLAYFRTDPSDPNDLGIEQANDLCDAFENVLSADDSPDGRVTLAGEVYRVEISDTIVKVPGDDNGQGMVVVPISILVP